MIMKRQHYKSAASTTNKDLFNVQFLQSSMHFNRQTTVPKQKDCRIRERKCLSSGICLVSLGKKSNFIIHLEVLKAIKFRSLWCLLGSVLPYCRQQHFNLQHSRSYSTQPTNTGTKKIVDVVNNSDIYMKQCIFLFIMSY